MNFTLNEGCLKYPYHCFCEKNPRFISRYLIHSLLRDEVAPSELTNNDEALEAFRGFRIYTDLETVHLYEVSNAYAYEVALRTQRVKEILHASTKGSSFVAHQSDEIWMNIKETLTFEHTRYDDKVSWSDDPWWSSTPKKVLPEVKVPSHKTDYLPVNLNMHLPKNELVALLKGHIDNLKKMRERKHTKGGNDDLNSKLTTSIKLICSKKNMMKRCHQFISKIKKPNTKILKLAECFFAYDMMELGFEPEHIARVIEHHRAIILVKLNSELTGQDKEVFTIEDAEQMVANVDAKTIVKWHDEIYSLVKSGRYKNIVSSSSPSLLSTDDYLANTTPREYYDPE